MYDQEVPKKKLPSPADIYGGTKKKLPTPQEVLGGNEPVKKKETPDLLSTLQLSGFGGVVGAGVTPSIEKGITQGIKATTPEEPKIKIDEDDPVGSIQDFYSKEHSKAAERFNLQKNEFIKSGESTYQRGNKSIQKYGDNLFNQFQNQEREYKSAQGNFAIANQMLEDETFENGLKAKEYLQKRVEKNGSLNPNNRTERLAQKKSDLIDQIHKDITGPDGRGSIASAAIFEKQNENPLFNEQLNKLRQSGLSLPQSAEGLAIAEYLQKHGKDLAALSDIDETVKWDYEDLRDNLLTKYPEFGTAVVANKVSREREKRGLNNKFANFQWGSFEKNTDNIADEILTPKEKEVYDTYIKENKKKYIDVGGFLNRFEEGIEQGAKSTWGSIQDITGQRSAAEDIYTGLEDEAKYINSGEKGWKKAFGDMGHFGGIMADMIVGNKALPFNAATSNRVMTMLTFGDDFVKEARKKYPNSPFKATLSAMVNTGAMGVFTNIFPASKVNKLYSNVKPEIESAIKSLDSQTITKEVAKNAIMDAFKKGILQYGKGIGEMTAFHELNKITDKILGLDKKAYDQYYPSGDTLDVIKSMAISSLPMVPLIGIGEYKKRNFTKNSIYDAATNPKRYSNALEMQSIPEEIKNKLIDQVKFLGDTKEVLDVKNIDETQQKNYLLHSANERALTEQLENIKEPSLKKDIQNRIKKSQEIKEGILAGKTEEHIQLQQAKKLVKEFYNEDLISKGDKLLLETKASEDGEPKFDDEKVHDFLKYVAQQSNNLNEKGEINTTSDARESAKRQYPEQLIEFANELFPDYKKKGDEQGEFIDETVPTKEEISQPIDLDPTLPEGYVPPETMEAKPETNIPKINYETKPTEQATTEIVEPVQTGEATTNAEGIGIAHASTEEVRKKFKLGDYERNNATDAELEQAADEAIAKGYNPEKLISQMEAGTPPTGVENFILKKYLSTLVAKAEADPSDANISEVERVVRATDKIGSLQSEAFRTRKGRISVDDTLAGFFIKEKEVKGKEELTPEEKEKVQQEYKNISESEKAFNDKIRSLEEENARLRAEAEIKKYSKTKSGKKDYAGERKQIFEDIREKLRKARQDTSVTVVPYAKELIAIAPDVAKLVKNLVENGVVKLDEVIKEVHAALKPEIPDITEKDAWDLIAGRYNEKKEPLELDAEAKKLLDNMIKFKNEREKRLLMEEYEQSSRWNKFKTGALNLLGVPRSLMSSTDFSAPLRQALLPTVSHPIMASKAAAEMFKSAFSQKNYDRWFYELEHSDRYKLMQDSGLAITDVNNPKLAAKEEAFMSNLAEKVPFIGKLVKGSQRAYTIYLNKMRVDLFNRFTDQMQRDGKTFDNSKEAYEQMAAFVNNMTGRGDLGKTLNEASPLLSQLFFSPRLMASRVNTLTYLAQPRFWKTVPENVRKDYFKSLLSTAGLGLTILGLAKMMGAETEDDPRSPDFGKIKSGNTRWDIWGGHQQYIRLVAQVVTGQKKSSTSGKITEMGTKEPYSGSRGGQVFGFLRGKLAPVPSAAVDILVGKNMVGEDLTTKWKSGPKEVGIGENISSHLLPLTITGLRDAIKDQGMKAIFTVGVPSAFGIGTQVYAASPPSSKKQSKPRKETKKTAKE